MENLLNDITNYLSTIYNDSFVNQKVKEDVYGIQKYPYISF